MSSFIIECRSCGAQIECSEGMQTATCKYCGSLNTVGIKSDMGANLYNRANYLRRTGDFDKAIGVYEEILNKDHTDAEAHWGIVLCKYGIEYVEDPSTHERIPTCHRAQYDAIYIDPNYKEALEYASSEAKQVYESEASRIDRIQKGILALAEKEERYDVFICYKESDSSGNRTQDSVLGQEIYYELTKKGYRVFYARKTLEGKLGSAYEPVIFAALNSAKVMVVIGTKPEHLNSVWVKNEWGRYRERMKKGDAVHIIPAYRDMSPYDLPQEFSNLQALDMSRIGFIHDLMDGIDKLMRKEQQTVPIQMVTNYEPLLRRAHMFLEDGDFKNADLYFERVLDQNPEEARAYIGKLVASLKYKNVGALKESKEPLTTYDLYNKAIRFATEEQRKLFEGYYRTNLDQAFDEIPRIIDYCDLQVVEDGAIGIETYTIPGPRKVQIRMKLIPSGSFKMGSPKEDRYRYPDEELQHQVIISMSFYMGIYEVSQAQWAAVMGANPSCFSKNLNNPVEQVSWEDCQKFLYKLNTMGLGTFRLPTEAEWEYACRAGSTTCFSWGDDPDFSLIGQYAWYSNNSKHSSNPVGQKRPNAWGLYDMHGNVSEWCSDLYAAPYSTEKQTDPQGPATGSLHVLRGGGCYSSPRGCRSAYRYYGAPTYADQYLGFRLVREL